MANPVYSGYGMPEVDFKWLGDLGNKYIAAKQQGGRERSLQSLAQGGSYEDMARSAAEAGDFEGATKWATLAETARQHNLTSQIAQQTPDIKNYTFSQQNPEFTKFLAENGQAVKFGNNPTPVWNSETQQWELLQTNNRGGAKVVDTQGRQVTVPNKGVDTGTGTAIIPGRMPAGGIPGAQAPTAPIEQPAASPLSGGAVPGATPVQPQVIPKDLVGKEAQKDAGKAMTDARAKLPQAATDVTNAEEYIDRLLRHPGKSQAVGFLVGRLPDSLVPTPAARDFRERLGQVGSATWSSAIQTMRGLGALSDREGMRLDTLRARLSTAKSEADFDDALMDAKKTFRQGLDNLRKIAAGQPFRQTETSPEKPRLRFNPATGDFE